MAFQLVKKFSYLYVTVFFIVYMDKLVCNNSEEDEKLCEHKISFKVDGDERGGNGGNFFASLFHCWYYNPVAISSLYLLAYVYHVAFQLVKKFSYLYVTVFFIVYMDKLVCSNSDIN